MLKEIGPEVGKAVVYRMASMEKVSPEMLELIERALGPETELNLNQGMSVAGGPQAVAAVLNLIPPSLEKELLDGVSVEDADLCEQVKNLMFVFEDMIALDNKAMQRVLKEVDSKELALALKIASDGAQGSHPRRDVEACRRSARGGDGVHGAGATARRRDRAGHRSSRRSAQLEETGEIVLSAGGDDEVIQ